jgi:DNA-binding protein YbaB
MKIEIDPQAMELALQDTALAAFKDALGGWEVRQALAKAVSREVMEGIIAQGVRDAVAKMDLSRLSNALAAQMERAATAAVVRLLHDSFVECILRLRGDRSYGDTEEGRKVRAALRAELFA